MSVYLTWFHQPKQKFPNGSFVRVAGDLGSIKSSFHLDTYGVVAYSNESRESYGIFLKDKWGEWTTIAWYDDADLTQITDVEECKRIEQEIFEAMDDDAKVNVMSKTTKLGSLL